MPAVRIRRRSIPAMQARLASGGRHGDKHELAQHAFLVRCEAKFDGADLRTEERAERTAAEQVAKLNGRPHSRTGATSERARLAPLIENAPRKPQKRQGRRRK